MHVLCCVKTYCCVMLLFTNYNVNPNVAIMASIYFLIWTENSKLVLLLFYVNFSFKLCVFFFIVFPLQSWNDF